MVNSSRFLETPLAYFYCNSLIGTKNQVKNRNLNEDFLTLAKTDRLGDPHKYSRPGLKPQKEQQRQTPSSGGEGVEVSVVFLLWEAIKGSLSYLRHPNT
ncbi:hypothetical protein CDAR_509611 [Caerostris darwini]|uniref:Uncharacterized protein n=1 Tax=Caerostris darwini TaxID=1538125 RepID=A0AAV4R2I2_9ARAC|nr:hypothetical protein CDAR_509611 [Caerostris darwini]